MKKIIYILLLVQSFVFAQESRGYVLDGSYYIGHCPHGLYMDTTTFVFPTGALPVPIPFTIEDTADQVTFTDDTLINLFFPGIYAITGKFIMTRTAGSANDAHIFLRDGEDNNFAYSGQSLTIENSGVKYNFNYDFTFRVEDTMSIKVMLLYPNNELRLTPVTSDAVSGRALSPCSKLFIRKISDL